METLQHYPCRRRPALGADSSQQHLLEGEATGQMQRLCGVGWDDKSPREGILIRLLDR